MPVLRIEARPHDRDVGDPAVGDPRLGTVEHVVGTVTARDGAHPARVAAEVPLGEPEASERVTGGHPRQPGFFLFLRAVRPDRVHRERALHADEGAEARVAGLELEAGQAVRDRARPGAAVTVEVHPQQPEVPELLGHRTRKGVVLEPIGDVRQHAVAHERPNRVADEALVVGEQRVDPEEVVRRRCRDGGAVCVGLRGRAHGAGFGAGEQRSLAFGDGIADRVHLVAAAQLEAVAYPTRGVRRQVVVVLSIVREGERRAQAEARAGFAGVAVR